ncbi:hypothetical protein Ancab_040491 [Ancistrocladus abbreviatus]
MDSSSNSSRVSCWKKHESLIRILFVLLLGQLVSFSMAMMSFSSSFLAKLGVDAPLTQSFFTYLSLALVYGAIMLYRRKRLLVPWYYYLILGFADVQGNYLVNKAYQFSSITSVTLLDCWTIAWVIILTWIFLGTRYSLWQYIGAVICVLGLGLIFLSDAMGSDEGGSKPILGDLLVVAGTLFYAFSNVSEEFCVKKKDLIEVISMLGVFGLLVSICEIAVVERKSLESIQWSTDIIIGFAGYTLSSFFFYTLVPFVLKLSGATLLNLSLLTSDMWAVVIRIFFYHQQVDWLYYLCFALVVVGLIIYSKTEKDPIPLSSLVNQNPNTDYQVLNEESPGSRDDATAA